MSWKAQYRKAITFSYDDGNVYDLRLIDMLNQYGLKATFNLNSGLGMDIGEGSTWTYTDGPAPLVVHRLTISEFTWAYKDHEIAFHTLTHPDLTKLSPAERHHEVAGDIENLEKLFGKRPVGGAYPFGTIDDPTVAELKADGIRYCRGVESTHNFDEQADLLRFQPTCHHDDPALFDLADRFLALDSAALEREGKYQIFYVWGHTYEFEGKHHWDRMEEFCRKIAGKGDIFYGTNAEVLLGE